MQRPPGSHYERPILLTVDEQIRERAALRVAPELSDPLGPLEVNAAVMIVP
jgi:hypothetical protein